MSSQGFGDTLVLDVGTSAVKAAVLRPDGAVSAQAAVELATHGAEGGVVEQDAEAWWRASGDAVRALGERLPVDGVRRLALTGQMQDLTLADGAGRPLRATLLYADARAVGESHRVAEALGAERLRSLTGNEQDAGGLLAKLVWLRRHEPEALQAARRLFLGAADAVAFRLTGVAACDTTTASTTGLMDLQAREPLAEEAFAAVGLPGVRERLPRLVPGGARVGALRDEVAASWRLPPGLPVHVGPGDAGATTVGAGSGEPGPASGYVGTSGWVAFSAEARGDPGAGVFTLAHPAPERFVQVAPLLTAGGNLAWARAALGSGAEYGDLIVEALARPPGRLLYLPYLRGERSPFRDPDARGCFVGLGTDTTHLDMVRAVLEGVAFAFRHALEALPPSGAAGDEGAAGGSGDARDPSRPAAEALALSGGGTRSASWCRLFASVLGVPVRVLEEPEAVGLRGALRCVQVAEGAEADYRLDVRARSLEPEPRLRAHYDALFARYLQASEALRPTFGELASLP